MQRRCAPASEVTLTARTERTLLVRSDSASKKISSSVSRGPAAAHQVQDRCHLGACSILMSACHLASRAPERCRSAAGATVIGLVGRSSRTNALRNLVV